MKHGNKARLRGNGFLLAPTSMEMVRSDRTGWTWLSSKDVGDFGSAVCEVCEAEKLRYIHLITHPSGIELWAGRDCAVKLCKSVADAIIAVDDKMRDAAEKKRQNSITIEGQHYLTNPGWFALPKGSPILRAGHRARFSVLPFITGRRVRFNMTSASGAWVLDSNGKHDAGLYPVASYPTNAFTGEPWGGWPPCEFAAVLLRDADRAAISQLTCGKPSSYTITYEERYKPAMTVTWATDGAAQWQTSTRYLANRASQYLDADQRWRLDKVLCAPTPVEQIDDNLIEELLSAL